MTKARSPKREAGWPTGRIVLGVVLALAGVVWTLQGLGLIGGSFMSGVTVWAVIGPLTALVGLLVATTGFRRH